jgi:hypothetical protein
MRYPSDLRESLNIDQGMRKLFLFGMAPPIEKQLQLAMVKQDRNPRPCGRLGRKLVPLDPRHGVFPNHVMTPLLATLFHLRSNLPNAIEFLLDQIPSLLEDESVKRFNTLQMPDGQNLVMDGNCREILDGKIDTRAHLLLVFGYWSVSSIVYYLLTGRSTFSEDQVDSYSELFLRSVLEKLGNGQHIAPFGVPKKLAPRPGIYFRLFTCSEAVTPRVIEAMTATIIERKENTCDPERVVRILRSIVPLPHDEAYKNKPVGKFQTCFMSCADPDKHAGQPAPTQVFWSYIGSTIAKRLVVGDDPLK